MMTTTTTALFVVTNFRTCSVQSWWHADSKKHEGMPWYANLCQRFECETMPNRRALNSRCKKQTDADRCRPMQTDADRCRSEVLLRLGFTVSQHRQLSRAQRRSIVHIARHEHITSPSRAVCQRARCQRVRFPMPAKSKMLDFDGIWWRDSV